MDEFNQTRIQELYSQLNGDAVHDGDVLMEWAERYRGNEEAKPLLTEIGRLLFQLNPEENGALTEETIDQMLHQRDSALFDARRLMRLGRPEKALELLDPWLETADCVPLSDDCMWMDFENILDAMLYQDYFAEEIGGREIRRHPLRPGTLFYTRACLLVELGRLDEALEQLDALMGLDPVCPQYLFEMTDALKRAGRLEDAVNSALWTLGCVYEEADFARCYRDLGYCMAERGAYEDAAALYQISNRFQPSQMAESELRWIAEQRGEAVPSFSDDELLERCAALGIPVGICETVQRNLELLE